MSETDPAPRPSRASESLRKQPEKHKIAVIIPARNEARLISHTVRACRALPGVDLLIVVDDGSEDSTGSHARRAGAVVVRHSVTRGKASALETGVKVAAMRDLADGLPRHLLFLDGDLGESALEATSLIDAVQRGRADCAIATLPKQKGAGGHGFVVNHARKAIRTATGWHASAPLSGQRCITREAVNGIMPFAPGWGVEVAMTIDLLVKGYTVQEVPCDFTHRVTGNDITGKLHRADQYKDVLKATTLRRLHRHHVPVRDRLQAAMHQTPGSPYNAYAKSESGEQE